MPYYQDYDNDDDVQEQMPPRPVQYYNPGNAGQVAAQQRELAARRGPYSGFNLILSAILGRIEAQRANRERISREEIANWDREYQRQEKENDRAISQQRWETERQDKLDQFNRRMELSSQQNQSKLAQILAAQEAKSQNELNKEREKNNRREEKFADDLYRRIVRDIGKSNRPTTQKELAFIEKYRGDYDKLQEINENMKFYGPDWIDKAMSYVPFVSSKNKSGHYYIDKNYINNNGNNNTIVEVPPEEEEEFKRWQEGSL